MTTHLHEMLRGGQAWSRRVARHQRLRLRDVEGRACVSALFYNARDPIERYNMPDTLKAQYTAFLTTGRVLYSDMGRVLAAIVSDSCGWHDSVGGVLNADEVRAKYGTGRYQELRNAYHRNGVDNLLVEMGKWNLGLQDLLMVLNLFSKVTVDAEGVFHFVPGNSKADDHVSLYAPMDTLVVLTALQHPMDPHPQYAPRPVKLAWSGVRSDGISTACRTSRPENARAFHNTERFYL